MAESARMCAECGRPLVLFSGVTINGAAFHHSCWDGGRRLIPQPSPATSPDQARRSEGDPRSSKGHAPGGVAATREQTGGLSGVGPPGGRQALEARENRVGHHLGTSRKVNGLLITAKTPEPAPSGQSRHGDDGRPSPAPEAPGAPARLPGDAIGATRRGVDVVALVKGPGPGCDRLRCSGDRNGPRCATDGTSASRRHRPRCCASRHRWIRGCAV